MKHVYFSFGGGVQSTAIQLLIHFEPERIEEACGCLPRFSIFADTGAEMKATHLHVARMEAMGLFERSHLKRVNNGSILKDTRRNWSNRSFIPVFTRNVDGTVSMLKRKCTSEFKIKPIERFIRGLVGLRKGERGKSRSVRLMLGISIDEAHRMRDNNTKLFQNVYPLIELGWDRQKCKEYALEKLGYIPEKSRCFMCPFISPQDWQSIKKNFPDEFERAVSFDKEIRDITSLPGRKGGIKRPTYLHRNCTPLSEAVVDQVTLFDLDDFGGECSGHCGL